MQSINQFKVSNFYFTFRSDFYLSELCKMRWAKGVLVLVLFPLFASVPTYDDVIGFSTENETDPTVSTFPEDMPLIINVSQALLHPLP